jgi:hypothetical protein
MNTLPALSLRPFGGQPTDLDLNLRHGPWPQLVTALLASCADLPRDQVWGLPVSRRVLLLVALAGGPEARPLEVVLVCAKPACGERMSLTFSLAELAAIQEQAEARASLEAPVGDALIRLRRPTGEDQLAWQGAAAGADAWPLVLGRLVVSPDPLPLDLSPAALADIDAALQAFDPLVHFTVQAQCPACGTEQEHVIDLQETALATLATAQRALIEEVHALARHYHWSEAAILALPAWRRWRYLALLEKDGLL